jgi:pimeloyl-ACP methyl ester carboxylesterase
MSVERIASTDGVEVALHDLGGEGAPVLVVHATGFCAGAYEPFAGRLAGRGFHVWAVDCRAHGESSRPASGDLSWVGMTDDVFAAIDAIADGPVLAFGHSMGGACLAMAELRRPGVLRRGVLFEPIIFPGGFDPPPTGNPLAIAARRRRPGFASRLEALGRYASRPPLGAFRADALWAYVEHGFFEAADGSVVLKCSPADEGDTFDAPGKPTIEQVHAVEAPMLVMSGLRDLGRGPTDFAPDVAAALAHGSLHSYDHIGHFGPFQDPDTLADDTADFFHAS